MFIVDPDFGFIMETTLIDQGISLMLYGMGTVFVFLTILVFATTAMSRVVNRLNPEAEKNSDAAREPSATDSTMPNKALPSPQVISAIEKAISAHRANK